MAINVLSDEAVNLIHKTVLDFYAETNETPDLSRSLNYTEERKIRIGKVIEETTFPDAGNTYEVELGKLSFDNEGPGTEDVTWEAYSPRKFIIARTLDGSSVSLGDYVSIVLHHKKWFISSVGGSNRRYFILLEDAEGEYGPALAKYTDRQGSENGEVFELYWWDGLLSGALAGYKSTCQPVGGEVTFEPGKCVTYCQSDGLIEPEDQTGTVSSSFSYSIPTTDIDSGSISCSGLPPGLSSNTSGDITGTPTTSGVYYVIVTGTSDKTGPGTVVSGTKCTITKAFKVTIEDA